MATADGQYIPLGFYSGKIILVQKGNWKFYPVPLGPQYRYRMRAWNTVLNDWEIWTSTGSPNLIPPSGDPVTNVTLIGVTEE